MVKIIESLITTDRWWTTLVDEENGLPMGNEIRERQMTRNRAMLCRLWETNTWREKKREREQGG